jgi:CHAT domain-containing protein
MNRSTLFWLLTRWLLLATAASISMGSLETAEARPVARGYSSRDNGPRAVSPAPDVGDYLGGLGKVGWFNPSFALIDKRVKQGGTLEPHPSLSPLLEQGYTEVEASRYDAARQTFQRVLITAQGLGDAVGEAIAQDFLAGIYFSLNQMDASLAALQAAGNLYDSLGSSADAARVWLNLGTVYLRYLRDADRAIEVLQRAIAAAQAVGEQETVAKAQRLLGHTYFAQENYGAAIDAYSALSRSILTSIQIGAVTSGDVEVIRNLAASYYLTGQCVPAEAFYGLATGMAQGIEDASQTLSGFQGQGNAAYCQGNFAGAESAYRQALEIAQSLGDDEAEARLAGNLGLVYVHLEQYEQAIGYLQQDLEAARRLGDRRSEGQTLSFLGDAHYWQKQYAEALVYYRQSLAIAQVVGYQRGVALMWTNIGDCLLRLNELAEAKAALDQAIVVNQRLRGTLGGSDRTQIAVFDDQIRTYRLLQRVLVAQNQPDAALVAAEAGRAEAFAQALASRATSTADAQSQGQPPTLAEIKALAARQQATLVEYSFIYDNEPSGAPIFEALYIWVIQPEGTLAFRQVDLTQLKTPLDDMIVATRRAMGVPGRGGFELANPQEEDTTEYLKALHQLLIDPIADLLPTDPLAKVVMVPHFDLFQVPFSALMNSEGEYLVQRHTLSAAPSLRILALSESRQPTSIPLGLEPLIIGNPLMPEVTPPGGNTITLAPLPGAEREALEVAKFLGGNATIGAVATELVVKQRIASASLVHLATHGLLDYGQDLLSTPGAIALTAGDGEDGLLTADEILNLSLRADLVVLSACDTGLGTLGGDGIVGLARSLMVAGTPSVIVSLWSVPDAPTAELMIEFYRQLQQNPDKAQALRQAMLTTLERHPDPRNWAAFTLLGHP